MSTVIADPRSKTSVARSIRVDTLRSTRRAFLAPLVAFLALLSVVPTLFALGTSFTDFRLGSAKPIRFVGLDNYLRALTDPEVVSTFGRTFLLVLIALPFELVVGYLVAKVFYQIRDVPGSALIRTVYLLPVMLPEIVVGLIFSYIMNTRVGVLGFLISTTGLPAPDWLGDPRIAIYSVMIIVVWQWTPLAATVLYGGLLGVPGDIREAAALDGAGRIRTVFSLEVPIMRRVIGLVALLAGVQLIGTFATVLVTTQGGPGTTTTILSFEIYRQAFLFFNTGYGSAIAVVTLIIVIVLSQILVRFAFQEEE